MKTGFDFAVVPLLFVLAACLGLVVTWVALQAASVLFGWPAEVTWLNTLAAWFLLVVLQQLLSR